MSNLFYALNISLENYEDRLYRNIIYNGNMDLNYLAITIITIFNCMGWGKYSFNDDQYVYLTENDYNNRECKSRCINARNTYINNIITENKMFYMTYGNSFSYNFVIKIERKFYSKKYNFLPKVESGKGYGICEFGKDMLEAYFKGYDVKLLFGSLKKVVEVPFDSFDIAKCNRLMCKHMLYFKNLYALDYL